MRKVRDYDAELKALNDKARALKAKKVEQLGQLVTGADALDIDMLAGALIAAVETADAETREAWRVKGAAFFRGAGKRLGHEIAAAGKAMSRTQRDLRRAEAGQRRTGIREWMMQRRERTRQLIELGGLVQKAGLVDLTDDDRATLYGALLELAGKAREDAGALALWKRRGHRAFDAESAEKGGMN